jgi:hypothetical protein
MTHLRNGLMASSVMGIAPLLSESLLAAHLQDATLPCATMLAGRGACRNALPREQFSPLVSNPTSDIATREIGPYETDISPTVLS